MCCVDAFNVFFMMSSAYAVAIGAGASANDQRGPVNVRDYGARGDGIADDTGSIQAAIHAAAERTVVFSCNTHEHGATGADTGVCGMSRGEVFIPSGNYTITRALLPGTLNIRNISTPAEGTEPRTNHSNAYDGYSWFLSADIRGEAGAGITQLNNSADIFYSPIIWRWKVSGLTLVGGRNHFHFGTDNFDNAFVTITDCVMGAARGAVVRAQWVVFRSTFDSAFTHSQFLGYCR
jgi:hypothetical protein